jgi:hypothetical protein
LKRPNHGVSPVRELLPRSLSALVVAASLFAAPAGTAAQAPQVQESSERQTVNEPRPTVRPTRAGVTPQIDGVLNDALWQSAARITGMSQQRPIEGAPPTEETEIWAAYDENKINFAFDVHYSDPSVMRHTRADRDRISQDDLITVFFDTFDDGQRVYEFDING